MAIGLEMLSMHALYCDIVQLFENANFYSVNLINGVLWLYPKQEEISLC